MEVKYNGGDEIFHAPNLAAAHNMIDDLARKGYDRDKFEIVGAEEYSLRDSLDKQAIKVNMRNAALANLAEKARLSGLQKKHSDLFSQNSMQKIVTVWVQGGDGEFAIAEMKRVTGSTKAVLNYEIREGVTIRDKLEEVFMSVD